MNNPIVRVVHTHTVGYAGAITLISTVCFVLANPGVLERLRDPATRYATAFWVVGAVLATLNGKGFFAPKNEP